MFNRKRVFAILVSLMMVIGVLPGMAFAEGETPSVHIAGGNFNLAVGESRDVSATIVTSQNDQNAYHVHWTTTGAKQNYSAEATKAKKITVMGTQEYVRKTTTLTAYLYEGKTCDNYYCRETVSCGSHPQEEPLASASVEFGDISAIETPAPEIDIKVNDVQITDSTVFTVDRWKTLELEAAVEGQNNYQYKWNRKDPKEVINFLDENKKEVANNITTIKGNPIGIKGLVPGEVKLEVEAYNKNGELKGKKVFVIKVNDDDPNYGLQGGEKQKVEIIYPTPITVIKENENHYLNSFNTAFKADEDINITFMMDKKMSLDNFQEEPFITYALSQLVVYNETESEILAGCNKGNLEFLGQNIDRSVSVKIKAGQLKPGNYVLVFGKNMKVSENADSLGVDVKFQFTVQGDESEPAVPGIEENDPDDPANNPIDDAKAEPVSGNHDGMDSADADKTKDDAVQTGDDMNLGLYLALMLMATGAGAAAVVRRRVK